MKSRHARPLGEQEVARAIAAAKPFDAWPAEGLLRLARSSRAASYRRGAMIRTQGAAFDSVAVIVSGSIHASARNPDGKRYTFALVSGTAAWGLLSLVDGQEMLNDTVAATPVAAILIPFAAIHAELEREPGLWKSVAREVASRARWSGDQWMKMALEPLRARAVDALVALAENGGAHPAAGPLTLGEHADAGPLTLPVPLSQERFGELLGVSRQTAAGLVRDLVDAGLVRWEYGRVSVPDLVALRAAGKASATREA